MKNIAKKYENNLKIYFQIRIYILLASLYYILFNYNFSFNIPRGEEFVYDIIYYGFIILFFFSSIYTYLIFKIVTQNKYKRIVYYINTSLLLLSLSIFIFGAFISENAELSSTTLILLPFLSFNIVSWIITKRILGIHLANNEKFIKKSLIGWGIVFGIYFIIGAIQPYNRIIVDDNIYEVNTDKNSVGWENLLEFNEKYKEDDLLSSYTNCYSNASEWRCFENEYFGNELVTIRDKYINLEGDKKENIDKKVLEMKDTVFNSLTKENYNTFKEIESEIQNISKGKFSPKSIEGVMDSYKLQSINNIQGLYRFLIDYNLYNKNYSEANIYINYYYNFLITHSQGDIFGLHLLGHINYYYTELEKIESYNIIYPEKIGNNLNSFKYSYPKLILNNINNEINYGIPDFLFLVNKSEILRYNQYYLDKIINNNYINQYKNPIFYNSFNSFYINYTSSLKYRNSTYRNTIDFFEKLIEKSEQ